VSEHRANVQWKRSGEFRAAGAPGVDPEQAFVVSLSACHMLWFLHLACRAGFVVDAYQDDALGTPDKTWMSRVTLRPRVTYSGKTLTEEEHQALHHKAHERCFIANSVKTEILLEPAIA